MNSSVFPFPLVPSMTEVRRLPIARRRLPVSVGFGVATAILAWLLLIAPAHAQCDSRAPGGSPNGNSCPGIASQPGGGANSGAGNPINVMTGNKYQREDDLPALPGVLGLEIVRHYNSAYSGPGHPNGVLGRGWRLSYETELVDRFGKLQVLQADGGRVIFDRDRRSPTGCSTHNPDNGTMTLGQENGRPDYTWTWTDGRKLHFNSAGKLDRITVPTGESLRLLYDNQNVLVRVIDPQGRSLNLVYYERATPNQFHGVQFIDTPVGRFAYEYGSSTPKGAGLFDKRLLLANLVRVRLPDHFALDVKAHPLTSRGTTTSTISRVYHHEDPRSPSLMTGISIQTADAEGKPMTTRYATYGYDGDGRAILSTHAGNVDKVTLENSKAGKVVLTNSLGQKTVYRYAVIAGENRLLEVRGAGCALCGEPNVRYQYNAVGQLTESTKLADNGAPVTTTKTERDKLGRVARITRNVYRNGKAGSAQLLVRFEYRGDGFAPALMARPSVVPGKELVTRIDYNEAGQPLGVTEIGWSPTIDDKRAAARIERATSYRYAIINGRSLLVEIDGPLPNGKTNTPLDSDITVIEYDHRSNTAVSPQPTLKRAELEQYALAERHGSIVTAIITPGNRKSEVEYDVAGRVAMVKNAEGQTTSLRYNPRGLVLAVTRDGITRSTLYDGFDHPVESGYGDDAHYQALARLGYDDAGRNIWTASALGIVSTRRFNTEGQLLEGTRLSSAIKQSQHYDYDSLGRLQAVTDANGGTRRIGWNELGLPDEFIDALGRTTRFGYDAIGNVTAVAEAPNSETRFELDLNGHPTAVVGPNGATTRYVRDDFGQTLATIGADSGKTTRQFDAAGRLVASTDANGNLASYEYDVMGRIVLQSVTDAGNGGRKTVTTWRYEGTRLVAIDHPGQAERYSHDTQGRVSTRTVILTLAGGGHVSSTTRYRYDATGRLAGVSLPDGSTLDYQRNGQNQITALERNPVGSPWLRRLLPRQTIVQNLERDVVGLKRLTYGNGIEAYYQRGKEGSLARIVYRDPRIPAPRGQPSGTLEALLGIGPAQAAPPPAAATVADRRTPPGALGLPTDPQALLDHRYLWDVQDNLLHTRDKDAASSYAYDARDRLIVAATAAAPAATRAGTASANASFARYHYDDNGNRLLAQEGLADQSDIRGNTIKTGYAPDGDRWQVAAGGDGPTEARHDAAGQPERIGNRSFVWDAMGKLLEVCEGQRIVARYRYNHRGERIAKIAGGEHTYYLYEDRQLVAELDGKGTIRRQYVYLADQPVAVIDTPHGGAAYGAGKTALSRFTGDIATIWHAWFGKGESTAYLQNNHLGAIEMATDAQGQPIWQAAYSPFGKLVPAVAQSKSGTGTPSFELNLRLPGQYADQETGLYYNDYRYYDPARGRYLTPDPLDLGGGSNGYAYVNGNPLKYIDPSGLVLFAFDGTGNTNDQAWLAANGSSASNVLQLWNLYGDGDKRYITGVGTVYHDQKYGDIIPAAYKPWYVPSDAESSDMGGNYSGPARIQRMVQYFNDEADLAADEGPMGVDIVGFSRGAAEARDFANRIVANTKNGWYSYKNARGQQVCQKVNFRFMGLYDTVLSTNYSGTAYNLAVPAQFAYVAEAVALNEHRGNTVRRLLGSTGAFPLESIMGGAIPAGKTRIERGFIGSHADIGGGFGPNESQLSQVALAWMVDQAKAAGIKMGDSPLLQTIIANPVIHDKSDNQYSTKGAPVAPGIEDRTVYYRDGKTSTQMAMTGAGMTWADTQKYISYLPAVGPLDKGQMVRFPGGDFVTGTVDMRGYLDWLNKNGYNINMKVQ
jgi:RHS repeat-associated protein